MTDARIRVILTPLGCLNIPLFIKDYVSLSPPYLLNLYRTGLSGPEDGTALQDLRVEIESGSGIVSSYVKCNIMGNGSIWRRE